jgi:predicted nuclease with RNAse H fold
MPKKTTPAGRVWLRERLEGVVPGLAERSARLNHDQLDAVVAAYTAYLYACGLTEGVGDRNEGMIYLPFPSASGGI